MQFRFSAGRTTFVKQTHAAPGPHRGYCWSYTVLHSPAFLQLAECEVSFGIVSQFFLDKNGEIILLKIDKIL